MTIEAASLDAMDEVEADTARWKAFLNDPEFMDALLSGMPKRPEGWWRRELPECPVLAMFELFPLRPLQ
jgi:hypothetical protein